MKVKLLQALAGDRFSFQRRQIIECSETTGARLVSRQIAVPVSDDTKVDGTLYDTLPKHLLPEEMPKRKETPQKKTPERAVLPEGEKAVTATEPGEFCTGTTKAGNPCRRKPVPGSDRCAEHPRKD